MVIMSWQKLIFFYIFSFKIVFNLIVSLIIFILLLNSFIQF